MHQKHQHHQDRQFGDGVGGRLAGDQGMTGEHRADGSVDFWVGDGQREAQQPAGGSGSRRLADWRRGDPLGEIEKIGEANGLDHRRRPGQGPERAGHAGGDQQGGGGLAIKGRVARTKGRAAAGSTMAGDHHAAPGLSTADQR